MGKTLKIYSYRGVNVYIRYLYSRWYELLVVYKGGAYCHQIWVEKPHRNEKKLSVKDRDEKAVVELMVAANTLVDNLKSERSLINLIKKHYGKITTKIGRSAGKAFGIPGREARRQEPAESRS